MNSILNDLTKDLSFSQKRELYEEMLNAYSTSTANDTLYEEILFGYQKLLKERHYNDRLYQHEQTIKTYYQRKNQQNSFSLEGKKSDFKHGNGLWLGVDFFSNWNYTRLLLIRIKSEVDTICEAAQALNVKNSIDKVNPYTSLLGILWYVPRFIEKTTNIFDHTITYGDLDYFKKYWEDWFNDFRWIFGGILTASKLLGPAGNYLTVALYGVDAICQVIKAYTKIKKFNRILTNIDTNLESINNILNQQNIIQNKLNEKIKQQQYINQKLDKLTQQLEIYQRNSDQYTIEIQHSNYHITRLATHHDQLNGEIEELQSKKYTNEKITQLQNKKSQLLETKERIKLQKKYHQIDQAAKIGISVGLFSGMVLSLVGGPTAPIIGATLILATCAYQYYHKNYYLPKLQVQTKYNPLEYLHEKLISHTEKQIAHLEKSLSYLKNNDPISNKTNDKLECYRASYDQLKNWQNDSSRQSKDLLDAMDLVMTASKIRRNLNITPSSYKALKSDLSPFLTKWHHGDQFDESLFKNHIKSYTTSSILETNKPINQKPVFIFATEKKISNDHLNEQMAMAIR